MPYQHKRESLNDEEVSKLIKACESPKEKFVIWTLLDTGLKLSEFLDLAKDNIQWKKKRLIIYEQGDSGNKKTKRRITPLTGRAKKIIKYHFAEHDNIGMSKRTVGRIVDQVANKAKISKAVSPQVLRHTFADNRAQKAKAAPAQSSWKRIILLLFLFLGASLFLLFLIFYPYLRASDFNPQEIKGKLITWVQSLRINPQEAVLSESDIRETEPSFSPQEERASRTVDETQKKPEEASRHESSETEDSQESPSPEEEPSPQPTKTKVKLDDGDSWVIFDFNSEEEIAAWDEKAEAVTFALKPLITSEKNFNGSPALALPLNTSQGNFKTANWEITQDIQGLSSLVDTEEGLPQSGKLKLRVWLRRDDILSIELFIGNDPNSWLKYNLDLETIKDQQWSEVQVDLTNPLAQGRVVTWTLIDWMRLIITPNPESLKDTTVYFEDFEIIK